jgi:hypothetical protein
LKEEETPSLDVRLERIIKFYEQDSESLTNGSLNFTKFPHKYAQVSLTLLGQLPVSIQRNNNVCFTCLPKLGNTMN